LETLGFDEVSSFADSGNPLFTSTGKASDLEAKIRPVLEDGLWFELTHDLYPYGGAGTGSGHGQADGTRDRPVHRVRTSSPMRARLFLSISRETRSPRSRTAK